MVGRGRSKVKLVLSDEERQTLQRWERRAKSAQALVLGCRIVLACAEGLSNVEVADRLGINRVTVGKWRSRSESATALPAYRPDQGSDPRHPTHSRRRT